jgi:elongation factor G
MGIDQIEHDIPSDMLAKAATYREEMIDKVSMFDDELAEKFLAGEEPSLELIKKAIRK